jgi:hypothetical protein
MILIGIKNSTGKTKYAIAKSIKFALKTLIPLL